MKKILLCALIGLISHSAMALDNCQANYPGHPRIPDSAGWQDVPVAQVSQDKFNGCPISMMVDQWFVFHLDRMDDMTCEYLRGTIQVICKK